MSLILMGEDQFRNEPDIGNIQPIFLKTTITMHPVYEVKEKILEIIWGGG